MELNEMELNAMQPPLTYRFYVWLVFGHSIFNFIWIYRASWLVSVIALGWPSVVIVSLLISGLVSIISVTSENETKIF